MIGVATVLMGEPTANRCALIRSTSGSRLVVDVGGAGCVHVAGQPWRRGAEHPTAVPSPLTLIGPWRYSIAGYDSVQAPAASWPLSAGLVGDSGRPAEPEERELPLHARLDRQRCGHPSGRPR